MNTRQPYPTTVRRCFRIEKKAISFFKFIIEGYDNVAVVETLEAKAGIIALHIAPGCEDVAEAIIEDLGRYHLVERTDERDAK